MAAIPRASSGASAPRVTVFVPVHDRERYVGDAIESVLAQTYTDFELLLVDDGPVGGPARTRFARFDRDGAAIGSLWEVFESLSGGPRSVPLTVSGVPSRSQSASQASGVPSESQSGSQSSGTPFESQSLPVT